MLVIRCLLTVAALLGITMLSLPAAHGMTPSIEPNKVVEKRSRLIDTPLSTDTDPIIIRNTVHLAWLSGELNWSSKSEWQCFDQIIQHESAWNPWSTNGMGWEETGGIPQAHPSRKMRTAGRDYRTNAWTQVRWGVGYIKSVYGTPCRAWSKWQYRAATGKYGWY